MIHRRSQNLLMIAARAPQAGATKTRLGRSIGMNRAATLYAAFLVDLAAALTPASGDDSPDFDLAWTFSPPSADFRHELRTATGKAPDHVHYVPQIEDEDWGKRQSALLAWGAEHGYESTVLIASDSPQVERSVVVDAFGHLESNDVVLGRVLDGGYYLIGQRRYRDLLDGVEMSTSSAADRVIIHAQGLGLSVMEVPATFDIDIEDDLTHLRAHLSRDEGRSAPATWRALRELGLLDGQTSVDADRLPPSDQDAYRNPGNSR